MIEIDVNELKDNLNILNSLIASYEEIKLNLFNQLKNSCINWHDGNSIEFDNRIYQERLETEELFDLLNTKKEIVDYLYNKYSELGKNIKCNLDNKATILYDFDNCLTKVNEIINNFNSIDASFFDYAQYSILLQKDKLIRVKNELTNAKDNTSKLYKKIESIEHAVSNKIKELEEARINDFDTNIKGTKNDVNLNVLNQDLLESDIKQIEYYAKEEKSNILKIYDAFNQCNNVYVSPNALEFNIHIENIKNDIKEISIKRNQYVDVLNKAIKQYETLGSNTARTFDDVDGV